MNTYPDFIFNRTINREERFHEILYSVPKLNLRIRLINGGGDLKVWFWNEGGVVKYQYTHLGVQGLVELKEKLIELGAREF